MKRLGIMLALSCFGAGSARADWEYTKWGMTPGQVASAAKNQTKPSADLRPDSDGNVTRLTLPYQSGKFAFEAQFGFDAANRLASVTLVLDDKRAGKDMDMSGMDMGMKMDMPMDTGDCSTLQANLKTQYGPRQGGGDAHMQYSIATWVDPKNKNNVKSTVLDGVGCYVQYSVIKP